MQELRVCGAARSNCMPKRETSRSENPKHASPLSTSRSVHHVRARSHSVCSTTHAQCATRSNLRTRSLGPLSDFLSHSRFLITLRHNEQQETYKSLILFRLSDENNGAGQIYCMESVRCPRSRRAEALICLARFMFAGMSGNVTRSPPCATPAHAQNST